MPRSIIYRSLLGLLIPLLAALGACTQKNEGAKQPDSTLATPRPDTVAAPRGVELLSSAGRFRILMPAGFSNPREGQLPLVTGEDTTLMTSFTAVRDTSTAFIIAYTDVQQGEAPVNQGEIFDVARDATLRNIGGTLERQESRELNGHPGRSIFFTGTLDGTSYYGRADYYLALPRLYQIYYIASDRGSVTSAEVESSFRSFAIQDSVRQDSTRPDSARSGSNTGTR